MKAPAKVCICLVFVLTGVPGLNAGPPAEVLPDDSRDASILAPEEFFGFEIGSRHLRHDQVVSYLRYLADSSERVTLLPYGKTHGQRPLMVAAVTSVENAKQLNRIRKQRRKLTRGNFQGTIADQFLVMYMGYNVHGDESSAVNAAPLVAYHLASSESKQVVQWLQHGVFLIDPALNPDGIDRFANWANENRGKIASPSALDREHNQPWPGGRTNYYWFDLNRDWLPLVHPESQGRLKLFHQWKPNVVLDFHEMSGNSSYFFQPGIPSRNNPFTPARNLELTRKFSAEHARSMDQAGELFYTEERFDDFYIGKGSTYPDLHGAVGILFEQGSTRGLRLKNDRTNRHFRDAVANQVRTSLSSLRVANAIREELLGFQVSFYSDARQAGGDDATRAYLLTGTRSRLAVAADLLRRHAIDVYQPTSDILFEGVSIPAANAILIPTKQAEYTFVRSLMEPLKDFRENIFYDVSSWHLPSAMDLEMHRVRSDMPASWVQERWTGRTTSQLQARKELDGEFDAGGVAGFAFSPVELGVPKLVAALQRVGTKLRVTTKEMVTRIDSEPFSWPRGTFLILRQANEERWQTVITTLNRAASNTGIAVHPLQSSMTEMGPDLGSDTALDIPTCHPMLVVGSGTQAYSAGALWHHIDVRMQQSCTLVETGRLTNVDLGEFSCVILPSGGYGSWSKDEANRLETYVREGGTVIAIASAIRWLEQRDLIEFKEQSSPEHATADKRKPLRFGDARDAKALESIAGAFLKTQVDATHPLAYGFPDSSVPVFRDHSTRFPVPANSYKVAAKYEGVLAGYVSKRNTDRLIGSPAAWVEPSGSGRFILLADNPVFRGYVRSSERFLSNAMLLGPALRIPSVNTTEESSSEGGHQH